MTLGERIYEACSSKDKSAAVCRRCSVQWNGEFCSASGMSLKCCVCGKEHCRDKVYKVLIQNLDTERTIDTGKVVCQPCLYTKLK